MLINTNTYCIFLLILNDDTVKPHIVRPFLNLPLETCIQESIVNSSYKFVNFPKPLLKIKTLGDIFQHTSNDSVYQCHIFLESSF